MKVGDLVYLKFSDVVNNHKDEIGMITELSEPTPVMPYQVAAVTFNDITYDGISTRMLQVINNS